MNTTSPLTYLTDNAVDLETVIAPYTAKIAAGVPLNSEEYVRYQNLCVIRDDLQSQLDDAWKNLVIKKASLIQRIFHKN